MTQVNNSQPPPIHMICCVANCSPTTYFQQINLKPCHLELSIDRKLICLFIFIPKERRMVLSTNCKCDTETNSLPRYQIYPPSLLKVLPNIPLSTLSTMVNRNGDKVCPCLHSPETLRVLCNGLPIHFRL